MNDAKPYVSPPPDADGPYKYYLLGGVRPVRATCDASGAKIFTESTVREEGGRLRPVALLGPLMKDEDVEEITKAEFVELCQDAAALESIQVKAPGDERRYVSPPAEADGPYKYYLLGDVRPVRVIHDERGRKIGAEAPDRNSGGALKIENVLLGRLESSPEVEDLTKAEFVELCLKAASPVEGVSERKPYISPPPEADGPYKYYRHSGTPVRIFLNKHGRAIAAEALSQDNGTLEITSVFLDLIKDSARSVPITKDEFVALCLGAASDVGRGNEKPHISPPADADGPYKYLLLGNVIAVRVTYDESGKQISAESPDYISGALKIKNILLHRLLNNPEVEDLAKSEFVRLCRALASVRSKP
jgi:hypothetical protein